MILYKSPDDGTLYYDVDDPADFDQIEVEDPVTLTARELCGHDGDITEILLSAGKAKLVYSA